MQSVECRMRSCFNSAFRNTNSEFIIVRLRWITYVHILYIVSRKNH